MWPTQGAGVGAALVCELQWRETHRTLDLLRSARAEGVEIHVCHGLYSGESVRLVKKPVEAEERTADGRLLPVEQDCAPIVQHDRIAPVHVRVIERGRDISQRISVELERRLRVT